jgi:hypothetical protein
VESVADNINVLREGVWREMPFAQPLNDRPLPRPSRGRELLHMLGIAIDWSRPVKGLVWRIACKEISQSYACERKAYRIAI